MILVWRRVLAVEIDKDSFKKLLRSLDRWKLLKDPMEEGEKRVCWNEVPVSGLRCPVGSILMSSNYLICLMSLFLINSFIMLAIKYWKTSPYTFPHPSHNHELRIISLLQMKKWGLERLDNCLGTCRNCQCWELSCHQSASDSCHLSSAVSRSMSVLTCLS